MLSKEALAEIKSLFAYKAVRVEKPLPETRREWEEMAQLDVLPAGATFTPVVAGGIASEWVELPGADPRHVFLLLHGGGYVSGSPLTHRKLGANLALVTGLKVLTPDYRLAPEHPFPAGVKDGLLAYGWLISEGGYKPEDVVIGGDSAGGGLALSMLLALREAGAAMPRAAVLLSPWTDLTGSSPSYVELKDKDPLIDPGDLRADGLKYAGQRDPADPMATSLFADLTGLPPLLIHVGGDEVMRDDSRLLGERAEAAGVSVAYKEFGGLWHVFHQWCPEVPEATMALGEIGDFVRAQFVGAPD